MTLLALTGYAEGTSGAPVPLFILAEEIVAVEGATVWRTAPDIQVASRIRLRSGHTYECADEPQAIVDLVAAQ